MLIEIIKDVVTDELLSQDFRAHSIAGGKLKGDFSRFNSWRQDTGCVNQIDFRVLTNLQVHTKIVLMFSSITSFYPKSPKGK